MVPQLEKMLQTRKLARAPMLRQLIELAPEESKAFLVDQVCDPKTIVPFEIFDTAPFDSLPDVDSCLRGQLHYLAAVSTRQQIILQNKAALLSRFGTAAIYDDLLALYIESGKDWPGQVRGSMVAYFVRYDEKRGRPLLDAALPADSEYPDANITFTVGHAYYSRGLDRFFRSRLDSLIPAQSRMAVYEMSQHGPLEDQQFIREGLERWRTKWSKSVEAIPQEQAALETEMIQAVIHGQNWQLPEVEASVLHGSCLSDPCRKRFEAKH